MVAEKGLFCFSFLATLIFSFTPFTRNQQQSYTSSVNLSTSWINHPSRIDNGIAVFASWSPILLRGSNSYGKKFACSFYCRNNNDECVLGVLIFPGGENFTRYNYYGSPELVWSANRNNPVRRNATLELRKDGDLVLVNSDGTMVWSSNTKGMAVAGLNLTEDGNLVLFDTKYEPTWQSFDHPTDSLVLGQRLVPGLKLTANVSESKFSPGLFSLSVDQDRLVAYVESNPLQIYYASMLDGHPYAEFTNGSFNGWTIPAASVDQFMKFGFDGHLKVFQFTRGYWTEVADLFQTKLGDCGDPLVCGNYGVCLSGNCRCPETESNGEGSFFQQRDYWQPRLGCSLVTPISCNHSKERSLLELKNTSYFAFEASFVKMFEVKAVEDCKNMCLNNCSCKAALFVLDTWSGTLGGNGRCLLLNEVFSIIDKESNTENVSNYDTTLFLKVQHAQGRGKGKKKVIVIVASAIGALFVVFSIMAYCLVHCRKRLQKSDEMVGDFLDQVPGMPIRYSYGDLKAMTEDFSRKLGEGGFGCVYEGTLRNGTKIAVKYLNGLSELKDWCLAEVETIGSIHHVNLVKLIGFCLEKSHQLLVYEYMVNGSLDRWIFDEDQNHPLPWYTRRKIISDVAKGLAYLHEECTQKIIHFDIKPQNILLDQNFNAKISDFGLSKLIEKDQSRVVTRMRGTPGYLAPEWLRAVITEKVDVYSFGVVILEIICGRKNLDWSKEEEDRHLLEIFKRKLEEGILQDLVDGKSEDLQIHIEEALRMMKIAAWCLQSDYTKRPSMSLVVKVLDGLVDAETDLDYDFIYPPGIRTVANTDDKQKAFDTIVQRCLQFCLHQGRQETELQIAPSIFTLLNWQQAH